MNRLQHESDYCRNRRDRGRWSIRWKPDEDNDGQQRDHGGMQSESPRNCDKIAAEHGERPIRQFQT